MVSIKLIMNSCYYHALLSLNFLIEVTAEIGLHLSGFGDLRMRVGTQFLHLASSSVRPCMKAGEAQGKARGRESDRERESE